jgi:ATP-binding cassette subfamily F protein uup
VSALPGGVDEYLRRREESRTQEPRTPPAAPAGDSGGQGGGGAWAARKELARIERRIERLDERAARLHERLAEHATDYAKLVELNTELKNVQSEKDDLEETWLELADSQ